MSERGYSAVIEDLPTIGVEEEFLLTDHATRAPVPCAPVVIKRARESLGDQVGDEFVPSMLETRTRPVATLGDLRRELLRLRAGVAAAAAEVGCRAVASGTPVVPPRGRPEVTDKDRYLRMVAEYGPLATGDQGLAVCGCHVHLGVADRDHAVRLGNHLRGWLPTLQSLAGNSPFYAGQDSGYASWRTMRWAQWPGSGPTPHLPDAAAYDALVDSLVDSGMLLDRTMVYWYARPSERFPTVELRVADVSAAPETVLLVAALARALAAVLLAEVRHGTPAPAIPDALLLAAHWRAARDGLGGAGVDLHSGRPRPAVELVDALVERAAPGLEAAGDLALVREVWGRLRATGDGATRQRAAFHRRGRLSDVVDEFALPA
ncbi:glutamate--cysteine ligase [Streptomyces sp. LX-29]|uniref:carboxylate-amine ligase n=1 Tax=Streptomyces sp. LX-29 TaxID=2900152 RepID=UPI00240E7192|nr:glutamate--cysteine ligase [Streptomyces sp. LX-29]WFB07597.1 glutamate--cysteine ligase [Streptomyces sp. LX-29]